MKIGDKVTFKLHGKEFHYELTYSFLRNNDDHFHNSAIFTELGYDETSKYSFCKEAYGYEPGKGCCPTCHHYDTAALTRLVEAIKKLCYFHDEIVEFHINGKNLQYTYTPTHLSGDNCENNAIFEELKVNKFDYCTQAYGYPAKSGAWPRCNEGDYEALQRLVAQIQKDCEINDKVNMPIGTFRQYKNGDIIHFYINGAHYNYRVHETFCSGIGCNNDAIFHAIGLESDEKIEDYCTAAYGYKPGTGCWPFCKEGDYKALERLINSIKIKCAIINRGQDLKCDYTVKVDHKLPWDEPKTIAEKPEMTFEQYCSAATEEEIRFVKSRAINETTLLLPKKHKNTTKF